MKRLEINHDALLMHIYICHVENFYSSFQLWNIKLIYKDAQFY